MRGSIALGVGAIALLLAALPNCSGDDSGGGDSCAQYYQALVNYNQRCQSGSRAQQLDNQRSRFLTACANAISAPGVTNVASGISACASRISNGDCTIDNDCEELENAVGTLPEGAACLSGTQCASGGCDNEDGNCGKCIALVAVGSPCGPDTRCARGASCVRHNLTDTGGTCTAEVRAKAGESCKPTDTSQSVNCDTGLHCNYDDIQNPVCAAGGAAGTKCTSSTDCATGLTCKDRACVTPSGVGGPCSEGDGCARGLVCEADKCVAVTFVANGQPCDNTHDCLNGHCKIVVSGTGSATPGTCEAYLADGAACSNSGGTGDDPDPPRCDAYANCLNGTCQIPNAAICK